MILRKIASNGPSLLVFTPDTTRKVSHFFSILRSNIFAESVWKLEKVVKLTQTNPKYAVGESLTIADLYIMRFFALPEIDPLFTEGYDGMRDRAPTCAQIYDHTLKHPVVLGTKSEPSHIIWCPVCIWLFFFTFRFRFHTLIQLPNSFKNWKTPRSHTWALESFTDRSKTNDPFLKIVNRAS